MASIRIRNSNQVADLRQHVFVEGRRRSDFYCVQISKSFNGSGTTAQLVLPSWCWDRDKSFLRGAFVQVRVGYAGRSMATMFNGYITQVVGEANNQQVTVEAKSLIALADTVYLGQHWIDKTDLVVEYPEYARRDGVMEQTRWTFKEILRDLFFANVGPTWRGGGGTLPNSWRDSLRLGSLFVLDNVWNQFRIGDLAFEQATLRAALDQIVGALGYVAYYEDFRANGHTYLQFYEQGSYSADKRRVRLARVGECARGSNVSQISYEESLDDVRTRIIALGQPKRYMVTLTVANGGLVPAWDPTLEAAVLADPESALEGNIELGETSLARQQVYRQYKINEAFRDVVIDDKLFLDLNDGTTLDMQVFRWGYDTIAYDTETGVWSSTASASPNELLEGVEFDLANLSFTLPEPAVLMTNSQVTGEVPTDTYVAAQIGLTISISGDDLRHDTGVIDNGYGLAGIQPAGLVEVIGPSNFQFHQYSNTDYPIGGVVYDSTWFWSEPTGWVNVAGTANERDDSEALRTYAEIMLLEKSGVKTAYNIRIPYFSNAYEIGDWIEVAGQGDYRQWPHLVDNISWSLDNDHSTTITTDSGTPDVVSQIIAEFDTQGGA